jgi:hypothetical protein
LHPGHFLPPLKQVEITPGTITLIICQYCGQEIHDTDRKCIFCGNVLSSQSETQEKHGSIFVKSGRIPPLGLSDDDISYLLEKWNESYKEVPEILKQRWIFATEPITKGWILNIVEKWARHKIGSHSNIEKNILVVNKMCLRWAWISTAIGIEAGKGQIPDDDVPYYLMACNVPLTKHLAGHIDYLLSSRWINQDEAQMLMRELHDIIRGNSIMLANLGNFRHADISAMYEYGEICPVTKALNRIDIDLLRAEQG